MALLVPSPFPENQGSEIPEIGECELKYIKYKHSNECKLQLFHISEEMYSFVSFRNR